MNKKPKYRFASVSFANAVPFTQYLPSVSPGCHIIYDPPSKLCDLLVKGTVDAALVPVVDLFNNPSLKAIGDIGICARGATTSTLLKCYRPLEDVYTVMKDSASSTSNALAEILFARHFNVSVKMQDFSVDGASDAKIAIGDRALLSKPAQCGDYDLSGEWYAMTGKPFVFAVWACRNDCQHATELVEILTESLKLGEGEVNHLAEIQAERLNLPAEQCREYLSSIIRYRLEKDDLEGMELFREMYAESRGEC